MSSQRSQQAKSQPECSYYFFAPPKSGIRGKSHGGAGHPFIVQAHDRSLIFICIRGLAA
jgi:hypothetical protein